MIQIGTADYQGTPIDATRTNLGTVYRSEPLITRDAQRAVERETVWCENPEHGAPGTPHFDGEDCVHPHFTDARTRSRLNSETDQEGTDQ